jgi:hypothetical protein
MVVALLVLPVHEDVFVLGEVALAEGALVEEVGGGGGGGGGEASGGGGAEEEGVAAIDFEGVEVEPAECGARCGLVEGGLVVGLVGEVAGADAGGGDGVAVAAGVRDGDGAGAGGDGNVVRVVGGGGGIGGFGVVQGNAQADAVAGLDAALPGEQAVEHGPRGRGLVVEAGRARGGLRRIGRLRIEPNDHARRRGCCCCCGRGRLELLLGILRQG